MFADLQSLSFCELCSNEKVKNEVLTQMRSLGKEGGLKGFEQVKDICLTPDAFSVDNDLLTPTFKFKRHVAKTYFEKELAALYA